MGQREDKEWREIKERDTCPNCGSSFSYPKGKEGACNCKEN